MPPSEEFKQPDPVVPTNLQSSPGALPQVQPLNRPWLRIAIVGLGVILMMAGIGYGASILINPNSATRTTASPSSSVAPAVSSNERSKVSDQAVGLTTLDVNGITAQTADIATLLAKALQIAGDSSLQGNLAVQGGMSVAGSLSAGSISGSGAGLTGVNAALLGGQPRSYYESLAGSATAAANAATAATSNAALRNLNNTFTASNTFLGSVTVTGTTVLGAATASSLVLSAPLTAANGGTGLGVVPAQGVLYGQGGPTLAAAVPAGAGLCLISGVTDVQWGSCSAAGGVTSLNGVAGALSVANATAAGSTITIQDASTAQKGLAQFNATNFTVLAGVVNTAQNIATTSTPTFAGLNLSAPLTVASGGTGVATLSSNGVVIGQGASALATVTAAGAGLCLVSTAGAPSFQACPGSSAVTGVNGQTGAVTIANASGSAGTVTINDASTAAKGIAQFNSTNFTAGSGIINTVQDIATGSSPSFASAALTGAGTALAITNNATIGGTLGVTGNLTTSALMTANSASITTSLNVGTTTTTDVLSVTNNAGVGGTLNVTGAGGIILGNGSTAGRLSFRDGSTLFGLVFQPAVLSANRTITVPNADGTLAVSASGNIALSAAGNLTFTGTLPVTSGGTGIASYTTGDLLYASSSSALSSLADVAIGSCLVSGGVGAAPSWAACPGASGVSSVNSQTGAVTIANASGSGGTVTIDDATTAAKGIASFNNANFSVSAGAVNTIQNIGTGATPTFAGLNANSLTPSAALTVGSAAQQITVQGNGSSVFSATNAGNTTTLGFATPTANTTLNLPALAAGTYTVCTTSGNCSGSGGGVTTAGGTTNALAKFSGAQTLADSILSDDGTTVTVAGGGVIQGSGGLTLGIGSSVNGKIVFRNSTNGNTTTLQSGAAGSNLTFTLPVADGSSGQCLTTNASGVLSFSDCLSGSGPGGGVSSLNSLTGALTVANASTGGSTITLNDASTAQKGIAQFNSTNFSASSGTINTIQDIASTASPSFSGATLTGAGTALSITNNAGIGGMLTVSGAGGIVIGNGSNLGQLYLRDGSSVYTAVLAPTTTLTNNRSIAIPNADGTLAVSASGNIALSAAGNITFSGQLPVANGGTGAADATNARTNLGAAASGANADITSTSGLNTITPSAALAIGATAQAFTLQGNASSVITATNAGSTTTLSFVTPTANVTYQLPTAAAGTYAICTTAGNCPSGGNVSTAGGTTNTLPKFTAAATLGDSILTDNGTTVSVGGNLAVTGEITTSGIAASMRYNAQDNSGNFVELYSATGELTFYSGLNIRALLTADGKLGVGLNANPQYTLDIDGDMNTSANLRTGGTIRLSNAGALSNITGYSQTSGNFAQAGAGTFSTGTGAISLNGDTTVAVGKAFTVQGTATISTLNSVGVVQTNGSGVLSTGNLDLGTGPVTGTLAAANGGTGLSSYTVGDLLYASGATAISKLTAVASGSCLISAGVGVAPAWGSCTGGGSVTTPGGTTNALAKFTSGSVLGDSLISDNGTTVTVAANFLQSGSGTFGTASGAVSLNGSTTVTGTNGFTVNGGPVLLTGLAAGGSTAVVINANANNNVGLRVNGKAGYLGTLLDLRADGTNSSVTVDYQGRTIFQPTSDGTDTFRVRNAAGTTNVLGVDTTNAAVIAYTLAIGTGSAPAATLEVGGSGILISGTSSNSFLTPQGASVNTRINIPLQDPGAAGQLLAFGLPNSASTTARAISIFDDRASNSQPPIAIFSPDETKVVGLNWNGSNTTAQVTTMSANMNLSTANLTVRTGDVTGGTGQSTGAVAIKSGDGTGTNSSSGAITIDSGAKSGAGTNGSITIGGTNASSLALGRAGITNTITGNTALGATTSDLITVNGVIQGGNPLVFEGSSADANETTFTITNPTADQTITFGNETGTVCTTAASAACVAVYQAAGTFVTLQGATPGSAQTGHLNITGTGIIPTIKASSIDVASAGTLTIGGTTATNVNIGRAGQTVNVYSDLNVSAARLTIGGTDSSNTNSRLGISGELNSNVTTNQYGFQNQVDFNPSGASLSNIWGLVNQATITGSALTVGNLTGSQTSINTGAGYTGQVTTGTALAVGAPVIGGSQKIPSYYGISVATNSQNGGNTSGTINNYQLRLDNNNTAAGVGGTLNNYGAYISLSNGNTSGTNNYGLYISGNGGGSANSNYAINSQSTAPSLLAGALTVQGALSLTTALSPANGGTGLASYTTGDLIYASGATTLSKLADVAAGSCLVSGGVGVAPAWGSCGSGGVTTVGAFSGSSQTNGASIAGNTITFGPADGTNPGMVTASGSQTFGGSKTFSGSITGQLGAAITGATGSDAFTVTNAGTGAIAKFFDSNDGVNPVLAIADEGGMVFQNNTDSASAYLFKNAAGITIFNIDSTGNRVGTSDVSSAATSSQGLVVRTGNATGSGSSSSGDVVIRSGNSTNAASGDVQIEVGAGSTFGNIYLGSTYRANAVNIGQVGSNSIQSTVNIATATNGTQAVNIGSSSVAANAVSIQGGTSGGINIGTANAATPIQIGSTTLSSGTQTIGIGNNNTAGGTTNVTIGAGASATGGTTTIQSKGTLSVTSAATIALSSTNFNVSTAGVLTLAGAQTADITTAAAATATALVLQPGTSSGASANGAAMSVKAGDGSGTTNVTGGALTLQAGSATGGSGTRNGGSVNLDAGAGATANGAITIGGTNATSLAIGRSGVTTTINGTLSLQNGLTAANGGTGITSYATGDLLYASGASTLGKLADVALGSCLISGGVGAAPSWGACSNGVTTVGSFSASAQTNGASIAGNTITFGPADVSTPGMVSTGIQTFAGAKTFNGAVTLQGGVTGDISFNVGANRVLGVATQTTSNTAGNNLTINSATGNGTGAGGTLALTAGNSGSGATGNGGAVTISGGNAASTAGNGGNVTISGGAKTSSGTPGNVIIKPAASNDSDTAFQVQNAAGTAFITGDSSTQALVVRAGTDSVTLGAELYATNNFNTDWTHVNWTVSPTTQAVHTTGNTSSLTNTTVAITNGATYQVSFNLSGSCGSSAETLTMSLGGVTQTALDGGNCNASYVYVVVASNTNKMAFAPTSNWTGTITNVSIKQITGTINPVISVRNASNVVNLEVRASNSALNQFVGLNSGVYAATTTGNSAFGNSALQFVTTGGDNSAFGYQALQSNTTGAYNVAIGTYSQLLNRSGSDNTSVGRNTLQANQTGSRNTALGGAALYNNDMGWGNTAIGYNAGFQYSFNYNTAVGYNAGNVDTGGTFFQSSDVSNSTAVGTSAITQSDNSVVLGSVDNGAKVGIGTTIPLNTFSVAPMIYSTGTASRSGSTVTGSGTTWTSDLVGRQFIFADGTTGQITAVGSTTSLTLSTSGTVSSQNYRIHSYGLEVSNTGDTSVQTNSTGALKVMSAGGTSALTVDTTNQQVFSKELHVGDPTAIGNPSGRLFTEDFEGNNLTEKWGYDGTNTTYMSNDSTTRHNGKYSLKFTMTGTASYAATPIYSTGSTATVWARSYINFTSSSADIDLMALGYNGGASSITIYRANATGYLCFYNDQTASSYCSTQVLPAGSWHRVEAQVIKATSGTLKLYYDGNLVIDRSPGSGNAVNTNTAVIDGFEIGDTNNRTATYYIDDIAVDTVATGDPQSLSVNDSLYVAGTTMLAGNVVIGAPDSPGALNVTMLNGESIFLVDTEVGHVTIDSDLTTLTQRLCHDGGNGATDNMSLGDCQNASQADLAEMYATQGNPEPGDIVAPISGSQPTVAKSAAAYQANIIGAVSTNPTADGIIGWNVTDPSRQPIALAGRIPVKVSLENGPVHVGDPLTASSIPGVAMKATKAGRIIGTALEDLDAASPRVSAIVLAEEADRAVAHKGDLASYHSNPAAWADGVSKIMVFTNVSYFDPTSRLQGVGDEIDQLQSRVSAMEDAQGGQITGNLNISGTAQMAELIVTGAATIAELNVTGNAHFAADVTVTGTLTTGAILVNGHIATAGAAPVIAATPAAGATATVQISGTDTSGLITLKTGATGLVTGKLVTVTFAQAYGAAPHVVLTPANSQTAAFNQTYIDAATLTTTNFELKSNLTPVASTTYEWYYQVIQ